MCGYFGSGSEVVRDVRKMFSWGSTRQLIVFWKVVEEVENINVSLGLWCRLLRGGTVPDGGSDSVLAAGFMMNSRVLNPRYTNHFVDFILARLHKVYRAGLNHLLRYSSIASA